MTINIFSRKLRNKFLNFVILITSIAIAGCNSNPATPELDNAIQSSRNQTSSHIPLGYYDVLIDTPSESIDFIPLRSSDLHLNVTGLLNGTMGIGAQVIGAESDFPNGLVVVDVSLTSPIAAPQYSGFDVYGILMTPGSLSVGSLIFADLDETRLNNADGYTRWWNPSEFTSPGMFGYIHGNLATEAALNLTATINPFKYFADVLSAQSSLSVLTTTALTDDAGRGVFSAGSTNTRRYEIQFPLNPGPQIKYGYAINASWMAPSPNPPNEVPDDFPIEANQPEAYRIAVAPVANTLYYDPGADIGGGLLELKINAYDWQGQQAGDVAGQIDAVRVFAPGLFEGGITANFLEEIDGKASYIADCTGSAHPTAAGEYLVAVRIASKDGSNYNQGFGPAPDQPVSGWQVILVDAVSVECFADINNDWAEAEDLAFNGIYDDQVCGVEDFRDYYTFTIGNTEILSGTASLYVDASDTRLQLFDADHTLMEELNYAGDPLILDFFEMNLIPGEYFIRVETENDQQVVPYRLQFEAELTDVTPNPVEVTQGNLFCNPYLLWIHDDYLFSYSRYGAWVYDITDPVNPVYVSSSLFDGYFGTEQYAAFYYPYMYFIREQNSDNYLCMVDFSDVSNPVFHDELIIIEEPISVTPEMGPDYLYLIVWDNPDSSIRILDYANDPLNPVEVGNQFVGGFPSDMAIYHPDGNDTHLIVGVGPSLNSYDVEDPGNISGDGILLFDDNIRGVTTVGDTIIATEYDNPTGTINTVTQGDGVLNWHDDANHDGIGQLMYGEGDFVYVSGWANRFMKYDVSDVNTIKWQNTSTTQGYALGVVSKDDYAYIAVESAGIDVYHVGDPFFSERVHRQLTANLLDDGIIIGNYYIAGHQGTTYGSSLRVIDISEPENAEVVEIFDLEDRVEHIELIGNFIYVIGQADIDVIDATDPMNMAKIEDLTTAKAVDDAEVYKNTLYMMAADKVLYTYDVTDPASPVYKTSTVLDYDYEWIACSNDMLYCSYNWYLDTYSIASPYNPVFESNYETGDFDDFREIIATDDHIYCATEGTFKIMELSDPTTPDLLGIESSTDLIRYLDTDGLFAYAGAFSHPMIFAIWPPNDPMLIYDFEADWKYYASNEFTVHDGYLYIASTRGLRIFDLY